MHRSHFCFIQAPSFAILMKSKQIITPLIYAVRINIQDY